MIVGLLILLVLVLGFWWIYRNQAKFALLLARAKDPKPLVVNLQVASEVVNTTYASRRTELAWELFKDSRPLDDPEEMDALAKDCFRAVDSFKRASFLVRDDP